MNRPRMRITGRVPPLSLLVAGLLCRACYCQTGAGQPPENLTAQVNRVLLALPGSAFPPAEEGTALAMRATAADEAHAAGAGHVPAPPHRVVRIHTLVGLFLLLGVFVAVEFAQAHARLHHRQRRRP